jgi:hypothetical protein
MWNNHRFIAENIIVSMRNSSSLSLPTTNHCFPLFSSHSWIHRLTLWPILLKPRLSAVSVYVKQKEWEIGSKGRDVTLFCWRAVARCCAPCGPIWFQSRLSVVSVYVKQKKWEIRWKGRDVTLFCRRAVARCCAPPSSIWLPWRLSVLSVYAKQK